MIHLIVAGGRDFDDWQLFYREFNSWFDEHDPDYAQTTIISGMADGADSMGYLTAEERGIPTIPKYAKWNRHGNSAGNIRNQEMADIGTHLLAFWDGRSTGTKDMIMRARIMGLHVTVIRYSTPQPKSIKTLW